MHACMNLIVTLDGWFSLEIDLEVFISLTYNAKNTALAFLGKGPFFFPGQDGIHFAHKVQMLLSLALDHSLGIGNLTFNNLKGRLDPF